MQPDWEGLTLALSEECEVMGQLADVLERERGALAETDLGGLGAAASAKEVLVPKLEEVQARRRACMGDGAGLRTLARRAPGTQAFELRTLGRRAADLAERVFLLNRGNGHLLVEGREFLKGRVDRLRFRGGRVVLYGRTTDAVSIGGASIIQRDL
jgi:flagellar biosynthesis/type III secretory pathway chaperone